MKDVAKNRKFKILRTIFRVLCFGGWASCLIIAMMSDSETLSFSQTVIFTVIGVLCGLIFGVASAELTERIKREKEKLQGDYRKYKEEEDVA